MTKKLIGIGEVSSGKAECIWEFDPEMKRGNKKVHITYEGDDGYVLSEAWENIILKYSTNISFTQPIYEFSIPTEQIPSFINLQLTVTNTDDSTPVTGGYIQLKESVDNAPFRIIGELIEIVDGTASYDYEIPAGDIGHINIKAVFMGTGEYLPSETIDDAVIKLKKEASILVDDCFVNKNESMNLQCTVEGIDEELCVNGALMVFIDDILVYQYDNIFSSEITVPYIIPPELQHGNHLLRVVYTGNKYYESLIISRYLIVREGVSIFLIIDAGNLIEGRSDRNLTLTAKVKDEEGNEVDTGMVLFEIESNE